MMLCEAARPLLDDFRFGLLEPADQAAVEHHLATCSPCQAAAAETEAFHALAAAAARAAFPVPLFQPPPVVPRTHAAVSSVRAALTRWTVAAGLALAVSGLVLPALADALAVRSSCKIVYKTLEKQEQIVEAMTHIVAEGNAALQRDFQAVDVARAERDAVLAAWLAEANQPPGPVALSVAGPPAAVAGAPNQYAITANANANEPIPTRVVAINAAGETLFEQELDPRASRLTLPRRVWTQGQGRGPRTLTVSARPPAQSPGSISRSVPLTPPVYLTHLATDRSVYRAQDIVYFRTLTLERSTFTPPTTDRVVWVDLAGPSGQPVASSGQPIVTTPADVNALERGGFGSPILGPDSKPIRGVGTGTIRLPDRLPDGAYTVRVFPANGAGSPPAPGVTPLATQAITIATADAALHSLQFAKWLYNPGDSVQVTVQGQLLRNPTLTWRLKTTVAGQTQTTQLSDMPKRLGSDGSATASFRLPGGALSQAVLSVTATTTSGTYTLNRPVTLEAIGRRIEFFPEGGDLIAGQANRVYVRATSLDGRPIPVSGVIRSQGQDVVSFTTTADDTKPGLTRTGLTTFWLTPKAGEIYTFHAESKGGEGTEPIALPLVKPTGVTLHIASSVVPVGQPLPVQLCLTGDKPQRVVVGAYRRGLPLAHVPTTLTPGQSATVELNLGDDTPGGMVRVTVFEDPENGDDLKPLAERLVFQQPKAVLNLTASAALTTGGAPATFTPGDTVSVQVKATDSSNQPMGAILGIGVTSLTLDFLSTPSLPAHFLLTSELSASANLENADLLLADTPEASAMLDLMLGTQGWRRFVEQQPIEVLRTDTDAADLTRLLVGLGAGPQPEVWSTETTHSDTHWPKFEAAAKRVTDADTVAKNTRQDYTQQVDLKRAEWTTQRQVADMTRLDAAVYAARHTIRRGWLPFTLAALIGVSALLLGLRWRATCAVERRWLLRGGVGALAVAGLAATITLQMPVDLPGFHPDQYTHDGVVNTRATVVPDVGRPLPMLTMPTWEAEPSSIWPPEWAQVNAAVPPPLPAGLPGAKPLGADEIRSLERLAILGQLGRAQNQNLFEHVSTLPLPGPAFQLNQGMMEPLDLKSRLAIAKAVPPPVAQVVRQYAHSPASPTSGDTVLWMPVLVTDRAGVATAQFTLPQNANSYRIVVMGHTLDGRLGYTTSTIQLRGPAVK